MGSAYGYHGVMVPASCGNFAGTKKLAIFIPYRIVYLSKMTSTCCNLVPGHRLQVYYYQVTGSLPGVPFRTCSR